ncbi:hypothetical protein KFK09_017795 [Dendrobium nobile]|uniref:Uncharacterized protein n=1 Tax=Dendrobium nobile TaxID=94219 RepID=A0A8T3ATF5_DENNO|nr:hypothetical protein KFK09_017795 [Dendrobium nobile]
MWFCDREEQQGATNGRGRSCLRSWKRGSVGVLRMRGFPSHFKGPIRDAIEMSSQLFRRISRDRDLTAPNSARSLQKLWIQ